MNWLIEKPFFAISVTAASSPSIENSQGLEVPLIFPLAIFSDAECVQQRFLVDGDFEGAPGFPDVLSPGKVKTDTPSWEN